MSTMDEKKDGSSSKSKHTLKLDFFIDLKLNFDEAQNIISIINILILMALEDNDLYCFPETELIRMEEDSIVFALFSEEKLINQIKNIIIDITKIRNYHNQPEDHYLGPVFKKMYIYLKEKRLENQRYVLFKLTDIDTLDDLKAFIYKWIRKITAINGKLVEEKSIFDSKDEILEMYQENKKDGFINADLSEMTLDNIDLSYANFKDVNFNKTNLMRTVMECCVLENAILTESNLIGANLSNSNLKKANLKGAQLIDSNLSESNLSRANLEYAQLIGTNLRRCKISDSNLNGAILARADAYASEFINTELQNATMVGINAIEANFTNANLTNSNLSTARLQGINLTRSNMTNAKLLEVNLSGVEQFQDAIFANVDWWNASEISENLMRYLRSHYLCDKDEAERIQQYKLLYGKEPAPQLIKRQNYFLGIKNVIEPVEEDKQEEMKEENAVPAVITQEYLDKLANEFLE